MPNIKSAKKRVRTAKTRNLRNKSNRSALKTALKKADAALTANSEDKAAVVSATVAKIDRAVAKGIIHKNNAARKKSSLAKRLGAAR